MRKATDYAHHPHVHQPETKESHSQGLASELHTQLSPALRHISPPLFTAPCILWDKQQGTESSFALGPPRAEVLCGSVTSTPQAEAFKRASARREVWQYHFLRLSAYETAAHTSVTALLTFTEMAGRWAPTAALSSVGLAASTEPLHVALWNRSGLSCLHLLETEKLLPPLRVEALSVFSLQPEHKVCVCQSCTQQALQDSGGFP